MVDGALATTLQRRGLPPFTAVDGWLAYRPEDVAWAHDAFARAGARVVLTGTFRALPGIDPAWRATVQRAVAAARSAGVRVWGSLGPLSTPARSWADGPRDPWAEAARALVDEGVTTVVLETFTAEEEILAAVASVAAVRGVRGVVASLVPRADGRTWTGVPLAELAPRLVSAGATAVGANCAPVAAVARALDALRHTGVPTWAKPQGTPAPGDWARAVRRLDATWVGGCCGAGPEHIAALTELA